MQLHLPHFPRFSAFINIDPHGYRFWTRIERVAERWSKQRPNRGGVLAWNVEGSFQPTITAELLVEAAEGIDRTKPSVLVDGGIENFNSAVDQLVESGLLKRLLAQTEIRFSNSLIESWWRVLKHQWLYLNTLNTVASVRKLVAFYVEQHNRHLPHSAFRGQTPDEMYFGTGAKIPEQLEAARNAARTSRMKANREQTCHVCQELVSVSC